MEYINCFEDAEWDVDISPPERAHWGGLSIDDDDITIEAYVEYQRVQHHVVWFQYIYDDGADYFFNI